MAADAPSVDEIMTRIRAALDDPACSAVGLSRAEAEAFVSYFADLSTFAEFFEPKPRSDRT
jgi:hypothetical protein